MSYILGSSENTIIKCTNPICKATFSVLGYAYDNPQCTKIGLVRLIPLSGNTPYYCPVCGKNLGKASPHTEVKQ